MHIVLCIWHAYQSFDSTGCSIAILDKLEENAKIIHNIQQADPEQLIKAVTRLNIHNCFVTFFTDGLNSKL